MKDDPERWKGVGKLQVVFIGARKKGLFSQTRILLG